MRNVALAFLLLAAAPAAAQTPAERALTACIQGLSDEQMLNGGSKRWCFPPKVGPSLSEMFPLGHQMSAAGEVVRYRLALHRCPLAKPGPNAGQLWRNMLAAYRYREPDLPAIRDYIDQEVEKARAQPLIGTLASRCEQAKGDYGDMGRKAKNAIVMRDGSTTTRKCVLDGSCRTADSIDVYVY